MKNVFIILFLLGLMGFKCGSAEEDSNVVQNAVQPTNIIFKANGTNPNWELSIKIGGAIEFRSDTKISRVNTPTSEEIPIMDVAATSFHAETETNKIRVEVFGDECINGTSTDTLAYRAKVFISNLGESEFIELSGCGMYLPDYRLNDIWVLEKMNGDPIDKEQFKNKRPYMELHIKDSRVLGFSGCNNFNGNFSFAGPDIIFSKNMAMTLMACPNMEFESEFINSLSRSSLKHSISNNKLTLSRGDVKLIFQKVD